MPPVPKPTPRKKQAPSRLTRSGPPKRSRVKPRNAARQKKEFARTFHSEARVKFVQREACRVCGERPSQNAHLGKVGKGASRRANYDQIAPLCATCHAKCHAGLLVIDRGTAAQWCADTERAWQARASLDTGDRNG